MKNIIYASCSTSKVLCILLLSFFYNFSFAQFSEVEPNNDRVEANIVNYSASITLNGNIQVAGDLDYYKIDFPLGGVTAEVILINNDVSKDLNLEIQDELGNEIADLSANDGATVSTRIQLCQSNTYYVFVKARSPSSIITIPYEVKLNIDNGDVYECNNSRIEATDYIVGSSINSSIYPRGDIDFYKFDLDRSGNLSILITDIDPDLRLSFKLYDSNGSLISGISSAQSNGNPLERHFQLCDNGIYYFSIESTQNRFSSELFNMKLELDESDLFECNESFSTATIVDIDSNIEASLYPKNDKDYYSVTFEEEGFLQLKFKDASSVGIDIDMYDDSGNLIEQFLPGLGESNINRAICVPGEYYFLVSSFSANNDNSVDQYSLNFIYFVDDPYECDSYLGFENDISECEEIISYLLPQDDDLYGFEWQLGDTVYVNVVAENGVNPAVRIGTEDGFFPIGSSTTGNTVSYSATNELETGRYLILVKSDILELENNGYSLKYSINSPNCDNVTSVNKIDDNTELINIYPNPASSTITIEMNNLNFAQILSINGVVLSEFSTLSFDVSTLSQGLYFVRVFDNAGDFRVMPFSKT